MMNLGAGIVHYYFYKSAKDRTIRILESITESDIIWSFRHPEFGIGIFTNIGYIFTTTILFKMYHDEDFNVLLFNYNRDSHALTMRIKVHRLVSDSDIALPNEIDSEVAIEKIAILNGKIGVT